MPHFLSMPSFSAADNMHINIKHTEDEKMFSLSKWRADESST